MNTTPTRRILVFTLALTLLCAAQAEAVQLKAKPGSKVTIEGTSTMHDWIVEGSLIGGTVKLSDGFPLKPGQSLQPGKVEASVEAVIPITSLRSMKDGKPYNSKMDEVMQEKLGKPDHKVISYTLDELTLVKPAVDAASPYQFESKGHLVVAGATNAITLPVLVTPLEDGRVKFAASTKLKMSDYKIDPPALTVFGIGIKTGDDVDVSIEWMTAPAE